MGDAAALQREARTLGRELRRAIPDAYKAYAQLHGAVLGPGALSTSTKELIALAIAVTRECDGCIAAHADGAARSGATADEVAEAIGVAILMNGGPATVYGPRAFAAFREFAEATPPHRTPACADHDARSPVGSEPQDVAPDAETTTVQTDPFGDALLDGLLHDLDVANDAHPALHGEARHRDGPTNGDGARRYPPGPGR
jgi:AhpD family alkylhydroperoxidase